MTQVRQVQHDYDTSKNTIFSHHYISYKANETLQREEEFHFEYDLQPFKKYFRKTLVFIWNSALRERFSFCFSGDFC